MRNTKKTYSRRPWTKLLSADQFGAIMKEYENGAPTLALCEKYKVSRSWLYRERKRWMEKAAPREDVTCLKAEIARLEQVIVWLGKHCSIESPELSSKRKAS